MKPNFHKPAEQVVTVRLLAQPVQSMLMILYYYRRAGRYRNIEKNREAGARDLFQVASQALKLPKLVCKLDNDQFRTQVNTIAEEVRHSGQVTCKNLASQK